MYCSYTIAYVENNNNIHNPFSVYRYKDMGCTCCYCCMLSSPAFACMMFYAFWYFHPYIFQHLLKMFYSCFMCSNMCINTQFSFQLLPLLHTYKQDSYQLSDLVLYVYCLLSTTEVSVACNS